METQEHGRTRVTTCRCGLTKLHVTRTFSDGGVEHVALLCETCDRAALSIMRGDQ